MNKNYIGLLLTVLIVSLLLGTLKMGTIEGLVNLDRQYLDIEPQPQDVLGNYYLTTNTGQILSLNRVVEIDEDSTLAKWYENMRRNFEREVKLNRIVKDDNDEKES